MQTNSELLDFEKFREQVDMPEHKVRMALQVLRLNPVPDVRDRRRKGYRHEWIMEVRNWIENNLA